jgi:hypothetical protein
MEGISAKLSLHHEGFEGFDTSAWSLGLQLERLTPRQRQPGNRRRGIFLKVLLFAAKNCASRSDYPLTASSDHPGLAVFSSLDVSRDA